MLNNYTKNISVTYWMSYVNDIAKGKTNKSNISDTFQTPCEMNAIIRSLNVEVSILVYILALL